MTDQQYAQNFDSLLGKTIASIRYMSEKECDHNGWNKRPLIIEFTDGCILIPLSCDESNDGGSMYYENDSGAVLIHTI